MIRGWRWKPGIVIASRMGSSRLPGKALLKLAGGDTLIASCVKNCLKTGLDVAVAVPWADRDSGIRDEAGDNYAQVVSFEIKDWDVRRRLILAGERLKFDPVIRITGDCPYPDPALILHSLSVFVMHGVDLASNVWPVRSFVKGLDVEVVSLNALRWSETRKGAFWHSDCEHVTKALYRDKPKRGLLPVINDGRWPDQTLPAICIDTKEDYQRLAGVRAARGIA